MMLMFFWWMLLVCGKTLENFHICFFNSNRYLASNVVEDDEDEDQPID